MHDPRLGALSNADRKALAAGLAQHFRKCLDDDGGQCQVHLVEAGVTGVLGTASLELILALLEARAMDDGNG